MGLKFTITIFNPSMEIVKIRPIMGLKCVILANGVPDDQVKIRPIMGLKYPLPVVFAKPTAVLKSDL